MTTSTGTNSNPTRKAFDDPFFLPPLSFEEPNEPNLFDLLPLRSRDSEPSAKTDFSETVEKVGNLLIKEYESEVSLLAASAPPQKKRKIEKVIPKKTPIEKIQQVGDFIYYPSVNTVDPAKYKILLPSSHYSVLGTALHEFSIALGLKGVNQNGQTLLALCNAERFFNIKQSIELILSKLEKKGCSREKTEVYIFAERKSMEKIVAEGLYESKKFNIMECRFYLASSCRFWVYVTFDKEGMRYGSREFFLMQKRHGGYYLPENLEIAKK